MADPDNASMRASDADREAVAERLRAAVDEGRLTITEYDDRVRGAYAAVTLGDLAGLTGDLPAPAGPSAGVVKKRRDHAKLLKEWRDWASTTFVLVGIWLLFTLLAGGPGFFWPVIPMGIWGVIILAGMFFGNDADGDSGDDSEER